ncbi:PAS domain-containing protein [Microvirga aerilata]|uniref:PAS domain-containing protein n=1 Tax=Microvirga aerilata TaxID=670292 RepID=UPI00363613B2
MKTINFEALFSASPNPYILLDSSLTIRGMNDAYLQVTMREREDLIGRNMFDAFPSDPDSPATVSCAPPSTASSGTRWPITCRSSNMRSRFRTGRASKNATGVRRILPFSTMTER